MAIAKQFKTMHLWVYDPFTQPPCEKWFYHFLAHVHKQFVGNFSLCNCHTMWATWALTSDINACERDSYQSVSGIAWNRSLLEAQD